MSGAEVSGWGWIGRSRWAGWVWPLAALISIAAPAACGGEPSASDETPQQTQTQQEQAESQLESQQASAGQPAVRERVLNVTSAEVGAHLRKAPYDVPLPSWLLALDDPILQDLPKRALAESGNFYSKADDSPTGESLWLHVFTDESHEQASDWVRYLAMQPLALFEFLLVEEQQLFAATFLPDPNIGDVALSIELLHGHSHICLRSHLLVFAQDGVLVFLFTSLELTAVSQQSGVSRQSGQRRPVGGNPAEQCDRSRAAAALTDNVAIARIISGWLSEDPSASTS